MKKKSYFKILLCFFSYIFCISIVSGADLSGSNFIVRDPVIGVGSGFSSSTNFRLFGSQDTTMIGFNNSLNFIGNFGFLYFPFVEGGVLSGSATGGTINLSWTSSNAARGFSVGGYNIGKSSTLGGPYVYTSVGNVLTYSYPLQTIGTYYFILQTLDSLGNVIETGDEINVDVITSTGAGAGGGGAGNVPDIELPEYPYVPGLCKIADFNCDGRVNLKDLSILLFYIDKKGDKIIPYDLSEDGKIDLKDASIMFYYWDF